MSAKKTVAKKMPIMKHKKVVNKAVIQPIIEHEEHEKHESNQKSSHQNQMSEMLEDMHDMIENAGHMSVDIMKTVTDSMTLTANLLANIASGASECAGEVMNRNAAMSENFMKCTTATDLLSFQHNMFDNNYGVMNKFGMNCGDHMNGFSKGLSEIMSYNLQNNWLEKFKRKKKSR